MTTLFAARPERKVQLGLTANPHDALAGVVWTDIPAGRVLSTTITRGANHELARVEPGRATVLLDNTSGDFDPSNTGSPYSPNLKPMNRLRIVDTWPPNGLSADSAGFEVGTGGWTSAGSVNCTFARSTAQAHKGVASMAVTSTAAGLASPRLGNDRLAVSPGQQVTVSAHFRPGSTARNVRVHVNWLNASLAPFAFNATPDTLEVAGTWTKSTPGTFTAPAGTVYADLALVIADSVAGEVHYIDTVKLSIGGADVVKNSFTGYVVDWPVVWSGIGQSTVEIEAYDAMGALFAATDIPSHPWEFEVRRVIDEVPAGGKALWLRVNEAQADMKAIDSSGYGLHGTYQGTPIKGVPGLISGDDDKAFQTNVANVGDRISLPYKNLLSTFPFSIVATFRLSPDRTRQKIMLYAQDGPGGTPLQWVQMFVDSTSGPTVAGRLAFSLNTGGVKRRVYSSVDVDNNLTHQVVILATSGSDIKVYIDGSDVTTVSLAGTPAIPNDLNTGYSVGNTPAVTFGDFAFATDLTTDVLDEIVILDGLGLTTAQITDLNNARNHGTLEASVPAKSGRRIQDLLNLLDWPAADRAINDGQSTIQVAFSAGSLLGYMQEVELTEAGRLFINGSGAVVFQDRHARLKPPYTVSQVAFGEGAGEVQYAPPYEYGVDDADLWNDVPVANKGGTTFAARDATSRTKYGQRTLRGLDGLVGLNEAESKDRADYELGRYKDPVTRVRQIVVHPEEDPAVVWPLLMPLDIQSRVTVKAQLPGNAGTFTQQSHIERIEETMPARGKTSITYRLSPADTADYWILGTSALDTGTRLGF